MAWYVYRHYKSVQRHKRYNEPIPEQWVPLLKNNVPLYSRIPDNLKRHFHGCIQLFLDEKEFVGHGIKIDDEIRLTVAANACLLLLHRRQIRFPGFSTIIIYPESYIATHSYSSEAVQSVELSHRAGESWVRGPIVLSWRDSLKGSLNVQDGHNVVLHEFAHKLDEQTGSMNGLPPLSESSHYQEWSHVLNNEFLSLKHRSTHRKNSVLDEYGTISPAEFFAVATESFFEKPQQMKKKLPELYRQFQRFYEIDPAGW